MTPRRRLLGIPQSNHHGSPNRSFRRKFNRHSREPQLRPSQRGLEFRVGTLAAFARATARIHGIGRRWRNWLGILGSKADDFEFLFANSRGPFRGPCICCVDLARCEGKKMKAKRPLLAERPEPCDY